MCNNKISNNFFLVLLSKAEKFLIYTSPLLIIASEIKRAKDGRTSTVKYILRRQMFGMELLILYNLYS